MVSCEPQAQGEMVNESNNALNPCRVPGYAALGVPRLWGFRARAGYDEDLVPRHPAPGTRLPRAEACHPPRMKTALGLRKTAEYTENSAIRGEIRGYTFDRNTSRSGRREGSRLGPELR